MASEREIWGMSEQSSKFLLNSLLRKAREKAISNDKKSFELEVIEKILESNIFSIKKYESLRKKGKSYKEILVLFKNEAAYGDIDCVKKIEEIETLVSFKMRLLELVGKPGIKFSKSDIINAYSNNMKDVLKNLLELNREYLDVGEKEEKIYGKKTLKPMSSETKKRIREFSDKDYQEYLESIKKNPSYETNRKKGNEIDYLHDF